jgi:hypothetical protein
MALAGWVRLCATLSYSQEVTDEYTRARASLEIDGYRRKYVYFSGEPIWYDKHNQIVNKHPRGYQRKFTQDQQGRYCFIWQTADGHPVKTDTLDCFISRY